MRVLFLALVLAAPAAAQAPDPARLAAAERIAAAQIPPGAMRQMMDAAMANATQGMMQQLGAMPVRELAAAGGAPAEEVARMPQATLAEAMAILDPAFNERMNRTMRVMLEGMKPIIADMEPAYRRAVALSYARRHDAGTLAAVDASYRTPAGAAFAPAQFAAATELEVLAAARDLQPKLLAAMPALMAQVNAATADLPQPRKPADLTPAERAKLGDLFGRKDNK